MKKTRAPTYIVDVFAEGPRPEFDGAVLRVVREFSDVEGAGRLDCEQRRPCSDQTHVSEYHLLVKRLMFDFNRIQGNYQSSKSETRAAEIDDLSGTNRRRESRKSLQEPEECRVPRNH